MGMCIQWDTKQWLKGSNYRDLPRGPVVRDLPCNTGDLSLSPGQGTEIPHAAERLSSGATQKVPA